MTRLVLIFGLCCCGLVLPAIAQSEALPANKVAELVSLISTKAPDSQTLKNAGQVGRLLLAAALPGSGATVHHGLAKRAPQLSCAFWGSPCLFKPGKEGPSAGVRCWVTTSLLRVTGQRSRPNCVTAHRGAGSLAVVVAVRGDDQESLSSVGRPNCS
jgi:hypothetical protein